MSAINKLVLRVECARHNLNAMCAASGAIDEDVFGAAEAAEAAGYSPIRLRFQAMLFAAVASGVAGAYLTLAQTGSFAENMTEGRGFVVIAAVTFGRWTARGSALACLLIAFAYGLKYAINAMRLPIAPQLFDALPYLLALAVLFGAGRGASAPASLALPYKPRS